MGEERAFVIFGLTGRNAPPFKPFATLVSCDAVCFKATEKGDVQGSLARLGSGELSCP